MRKITIIGAGQAGLHLGIGLLAKGFDVTLVSNRSAADIAAGKVMSSQSMYDMAIGYERELGLTLWDEHCPPIEGVHMRAGTRDGATMVDWRSRMRANGQSVDQRIKMPAWMDLFQRKGGRLVVEEAGIAEIEGYAERSDLVLVATGKGELGRLFERDAERSVFDHPMRTISLTYVHGMKPREDFSALNISINPGIGEYVNFPALTHTGPCDIINLECIEGGPMDRWSEVSTPAEHLALATELIHEFFPWEAPRCAQLRLTDDNGILVGRVTPTVRKPVGTLPSGRRVLGMADVLVLNDPITGQGSNNAAKCVKVYLDAILEHGARTFDADWMSETFERYWDYAQWVTRFTNTHLLPPPPQVLKVFAACGENPRLAARVANAFDDPKGLAPWYYDPVEADRFIESFAVATA
ncbi:MAG TPA: styrene monooxygenase/indole monooxygenase family protein [Aromatoleum sp.]|uniref:styrene monooxygenase/indole monooxygenase family protein n=1 Tax=Aromatoleum sp. TaxID=2307007 RepID=UPI002B46AA68|nr:styrene monooxygenase/indole monooxygenase family protein [Aromatoleum sp.]HJV25976.1 styrene monooxygenase/indole monooxygenase family protein [Aromatoleum sp.]